MDFLSPGAIAGLIPTYGLWLLFAVVMLESSGVPLPGETALVTTAVYAGSTHHLGIGSVVGVAAAAAIIGDNLGYTAGRLVGVRLLVRYGRHLHLTEARLRIGQYMFMRHGGKIVFFGRFVAFLRAFAAILAGANRMPWPHFLVMNAMGGFAWATVFGVGAYVFGEQMKRIAGPVGLLLLAAAIGAILAGTVFFRRHERELERRAVEAIPGPLV